LKACLGPLERPSRPAWRLPEGAWDMHFHVLGPQKRYPYAAARNYTPPDAPLEHALRLHDGLGIARGLVVHANTHGFDNSIDLDAVNRSDGKYLAVVRLDASATQEGCRNLHKAGARGVRFAFNPQHGGALDRAAFDHVVRCTEGLGWFVELHFEGAALAGLADWIAAIPATVVIDHFGRVDASLGVNQPSWRALEELVQKENIWIKLSGAERISAAGAPYPDVVPLAHRLLELAPERLVWGSDWPHTGCFDAARMPDDGKLLDALLTFVPDETLRKKVLVDNPLTLIRGQGRNYSTLCAQ
jgi:predicted TIM-barrel fold metal-dependent hydrolase